jgi:hypothetical protein
LLIKSLQVKLQQLQDSPKVSLTADLSGISVIRRIRVCRIKCPQVNIRSAFFSVVFCLTKGRPQVTHRPGTIRSDTNEGERGQHYKGKKNTLSPAGGKLATNIQIFLFFTFKNISLSLTLPGTSPRRFAPFCSEEILLLSF